MLYLFLKFFFLFLQNNFVEKIENRKLYIYVFRIFSKAKYNIYYTFEINNKISYIQK